MSIIVKIQRPLSTNAEILEAFIYNEDRSTELMVDYSTVEYLFVNDELKVYCVADVVGDGLLIGERVPDEDW